MRRIAFILKDRGGFIAFRPDNPGEHIHFANEQDLQNLVNEAVGLLGKISEARRKAEIEKQAASLVGADGKALLPEGETND